MAVAGAGTTVSERQHTAVEALPISVVLITRDAGEHLAKVLAALPECDEILVVDSGSSDDTIAIAEAFQARVIHQDFLGFGPQKRFAVSQARHDWVLCLDADEVLDAAAATAIGTADLSNPQVCWRIRRRTFIGAREVRYGHWHPDRCVRLFNRTVTTWSEDAVHESVPAAPVVRTLAGAIDHYSYRDYADVFRMGYQRTKAERYRAKGRRAGAILLLLRAWLAFMKSWLWRRGFLDGRAGVVVAISASVNAVVGLAIASDSPAEASADTTEPTA